MWLPLHFLTKIKWKSDFCLVGVNIILLPLHNHIMKKILVPTDFSPVADNALKYACEIAHKTDAAIVLLHTYHIPLISTDVPVYVDFTVLEEIKKSANERLIELKGKIANDYLGLQVVYFLEEGDVSFQVEQLVNKREYDLVVMGTTGAGTLEGLLIGSNTFDVINSLQIPVLAVPKEAIFNGIRKTAFGTNCKEDDLFLIQDFIAFAAAFDAKLTVIHLGQKEEDADDLIAWFEQDAKQKLTYEKLSFRMFYSKDVYHDLNEYLTDHNYDMLVLHKRNPGFIESILKPSLTKKFAFHSNIPLLVYK